MISPSIMRSSPSTSTSPPIIIIVAAFVITAIVIVVIVVIAIIWLLLLSNLHRLQLISDHLLLFDVIQLLLDSLITLTQLPFITPIIIANHQYITLLIMPLNFR